MNGSNVYKKKLGRSAIFFLLTNSFEKRFRFCLTAYSIPFLK